MLADQDLLRRLEFDPVDYAPANWEVATFAPFRMAYSTDLGVSFAAPVEPIDPSSEVGPAAHMLLNEARSAGCSLVVEFNEPLWPGLASQLVTAGLIQENREPLLACTPETFRLVTNRQVHVRFLDPADPPDEFDAFQSVVAAGLAAKQQPLSDGALVRFREEIGPDGTCRAVVACLEGQPVGTGYSWCNLGRTQITRIHTLRSARRRGVASAVSSELVRDAFERCGDLVWLTASGPPAVDMYEKLGFCRLGDRLFYQHAAGA
ncbi:MAG: GNAT family N-acetyltransferase [Chloroflexi bacterium]|nr:GNAT family N-acetyltransferase [Chloroflexota bacterium]